MEIRKEVVHSLREDTRPIDRVDGAEAVFLVEFAICEEGFDDVLAVVKCSFHGDVVDV